MSDLYDFGNSWHHDIVLEAMMPAPAKVYIRDVLPDRVPVLLKIVVAYRVMLISYKCLATLNMKIMTI